jgi:hypothetical protein
MYAVIRHYHFDKKDSPEIERLVHDEFLPLIRKADGFVDFYWLNDGNSECASLSVFDDKAGADESVRLAADFVRKNMAELLREKPEIIAGPVSAHD